MKKTKQFATIEELEIWLNNEEDALFDVNTDPFAKSLGTNAEILAKKLENEGYDLDNLVADGHDYEFAGHTNKKKETS